MLKQRGGLAWHRNITSVLTPCQFNFVSSDPSCARQANISDLDSKTQQYYSILSLGIVPVPIKRSKFFLIRHEWLLFRRGWSSWFSSSGHCTAWSMCYKKSSRSQTDTIGELRQTSGAPWRIRGRHFSTSLAHHMFFPLFLFSVQPSSETAVGAARQTLVAQLFASG